MTPYEQQLADIRAKVVEVLENVTRDQLPERFWVEMLHTYRPIRLADVLLAMEANIKDRGEQIGYDFTEFVDFDKSFDKHRLRIVTSWNLRTDDLTKQSPETVAFIHSLLV